MKKMNRESYPALCMKISKGESNEEKSNGMCRWRVIIV